MRFPPVGLAIGLQQHIKAYIRVVVDALSWIKKVQQGIWEKIKIKIWVFSFLIKSIRAPDLAASKACVLYNRAYTQ